MFSFQKWPVTLIIRNLRDEGGYSIEFDKARRITLKNGVEEWRRRKYNELIPPIFYEELSNNNAIEVYRTKNGQYGKVEFDSTTGTIKSVSSDVTNWNLYNKDKLRRRFENPGFWEKNRDTIIAVVLMIGIGIVVYTVMSGTTTVLNELKGMLAVI